MNLLQMMQMVKMSRNPQMMVQTLMQTNPQMKQAIYGQFMGNFFINVGYFYKFGLYFAKNKTPERAFKSGDLRYFREK